MNFKRSNLFFIIYFLSVFLSCISIRPLHVHQTPLPWPYNDRSPTIVMLPFENTTGEKNLGIVIRRILADHLSAKNYRDLNLNEVDEALIIFEHLFGNKWQDFSPVSLGKLFRCNFLIYGEVNKFKRLFWGVYAQVAIGVQVKIVETVHGDIIWERKLVRRVHEGGIPFNPFNKIPELLYCSIHIKEETKAALFERTCKELAAEIPNPPKPAVTIFKVEIQVAAFTEKNRAIKVMKDLKSKGHDARIEKVMFSNGAWYRIVLGPYYDQHEAVIIKHLLEQDPRFHPFFIHY